MNNRSAQAQAEALRFLIEGACEWGCKYGVPWEHCSLKGFCRLVRADPIRDEKGEKGFYQKNRRPKGMRNNDGI